MSKKTVFVIGAGASKEALLPTGHELKKTISKSLDIRFEDSGQSLKSGSYEIMEALRANVRGADGRRGDINPYLKEAWHIRDALPQAISIDNFIDTHRGNHKMALCGKLAIVDAILFAEKESLLYFDKRNTKENIDFKRLSNTWYIPFFQLVTENCTKDDLEERFKSIALVIFNYDRCIEHFIYYALQNYYKISGGRAFELVESMNIYHPYGDIGALDWAQNGKVEFGLKPSSHQLLECANRIQTFTEGTDPDSSEVLEIREHMGRVNKLVFMGFAFHKLNMELISPNNFHGRSDVECFATTFKISDSDTEVIEEKIGDLYRGIINIKTSNLSCGEFFNEFSRSLGF